MNQLLKLGYTSMWLELGLLSECEYDKQLATFKTSSDKNTEHYRYATFRKFLTSRKRLTEQELDNYLKVVHFEQDEPMAGSAIVDILREIELTDSQFEKVCSAIEDFGVGSATQLILRQKLLRQLKSGNLSDPLFAECLQSGDGVVQDYLINLSSKNKLQQLVDHGITKAIKNKAKEKLIKFQKNTE